MLALSRIKATIFRGSYLLVALFLLLSPNADAASAKDFAKCREILNKNASWLLGKADKAKEKYDKKVQLLVSRHATERPDPGEEERLSGIVDDLIARSDQADFRRVLVDDPYRDVQNVENTPDFVCWNAADVKRIFKSNLQRYEENLDEFVTEISDRLEIENLGPDEGLVAILFYAKGAAQDVRINRLKAIGGSIHFGPVNNGDYFRILKVKAGDYRWHMVQNRTTWGAYNAYLKGSKHDFTVEAGKLNYTGAFTFQTDWWYMYRTGVANRMSVVLSLIESRYPGLLETIPFNDGLDADNRFVEFYLQEKRASQAEDDSA
jgi:hypothetical protein